MVLSTLRLQFLNHPPTAAPFLWPACLSWLMLKRGHWACLYYLLPPLGGNLAGEVTLMNVAKVNLVFSIPLPRDRKDGTPFPGQQRQVQFGPNKAAEV